MVVSKVLSRVTRGVDRRSLLCLFSPLQQQRVVPILYNQFHSLARENPYNFVAGNVCLSSRSLFSIQRFGLSSTASPAPSDKEQGDATTSNDASTDADPRETNGDANLGEQIVDSISGESKRSGLSDSPKRRRGAAKRTAFSDSDTEAEVDLSKDDLVKLVSEKEEQLKLKHEEMEKMKDKFLRSYAELENVMQRTKREAENSKKFAIQSFAKSLLDVADNLGRGSSVVKESFSKIDTSNDPSGAVPLLKTLLEGVEMTEKQLTEVFKKFGVEKYDPTNEPFDPHKHNAVFQMPDATKSPGTVAAVLKAGYMLHDRVLRPAEVGVVQETEASNADEQSK